ncbi:hypothetical protein PHYSODRAFT_525930 [Phytophthora sojae]|uniref:Uncharacterized protein n=1 Tax=Phytophthora sojae (strain P6497) TaxID=1094619 RepID=G5A742_PHYSP|nr:hypothetical protein PHYSODRAFT_525930 [Phytophthora sojae]EGZ09147.1 hypothetical protein PHYSODRAFT_525930 [Phytophthora sojae]|eukprot:XP_009535780.1 hypothetical protein PHYSODRAFT_525930 [Phytophthora sojae]
MFVRTETAFAYTKLFSVCKQRCQEILDLRFGALDHSTSVANAFQTVWSEIKLLDCWPHLDRNSRKKKGLLAEHDRYNDIIKRQIDYLSKSRSKQQFEGISALITQNWDDLGEGEYAAWLDTEYLTKPWELLFYTTSYVPGILPNQNTIASHHPSIKTTAVNQLRVSTGHVLASTLPKILVECAMEIGSEPIQHLAARPVSAEVLEAGVLLCNDDNHFPTHKRKTCRAIRNIQAYYFNQRYYIVRGDNVHGLKVNASRTKTYESSLSGSLKSDEIVENVQLRYLSLHKMTVLDRLPYEHDWYSPLWPWRRSTPSEKSSGVTAKISTRRGSCVLMY